jgi:hypothetical protein
MSELLNNITIKNHEPLPSKVIQFVHKVIVDGRYVDEFQNKPYEVAKKLDLTIDPDIETSLRNNTSDQLFEGFYREQFNLNNHSIHPYILSPGERKADIGASVAIGIVLIIGGVAVVVGAALALTDAKAGIIDESDEKDTKL